jgi:hypothetical protein
VGFSATRGAIAVGDGGKILQSQSSGRVWSGRSSGTSKYLEAVHFADASTGFAVGDSGVIQRTYVSLRAEVRWYAGTGGPGAYELVSNGVNVGGLLHRACA